jgi:hypothetical protein
LDPILTVIRPLTAFFTSCVAGLVENFTNRTKNPVFQQMQSPELEEGEAQPFSRASSGARSLRGSLSSGIGFAANELMSDLAGWFLLGIGLAALITVLIPESWFNSFLGAGIVSYLAVLIGSLPLYVCASMSTPIAAALVLKGMSPGAALVLLMAGPATNMATITMVGGMLGRRTLVIYLGSIVTCTLIMAFLTDMVYAWLGISAKAVAGAAGRELIPEWVQLLSAGLLAILMIRVLLKKVNTCWFSPIQEVSPTSSKVGDGCCECAGDRPGGT